MEKLLCGKCQEAGLKSTIRCGGGTQTAMGTSAYYDEEGEYHYHDPNTLTMSYTCSNNHVFIMSSNPPCPNEKCDHGKGEKCIEWKDDLTEGDFGYNPNVPTTEKDQS